MRKPTMKMFVSLIFVLFTALGVDAGAKLKPRASTTSAVAHSTPDDPTQTGTISTCNKWYDVVLGDTCASVEAAFGITSAQFLAWNPAVSSNCQTNFWVGDSYCVGVGTASSSQTSSFSSTGTSRVAHSTPDDPTQTGTISTCNMWYDVQKGDTCAIVEAAFGITNAQFLAWNPAVSSDCNTNFWVGDSYCVGTGTITFSSTTSLFSSSSSAAATTTAPPGTYSIIAVPTTAIAYSTTNDTWPPTATQSGIVSNCQRWYKVQAGDSCAGIAITYATILTQDMLLAWNPALGSDCSGLWVNYWVCIWAPAATSEVPTTTATSIWMPSWTPSILPTLNSTFLPSPTQAGLVANCQGFYQAQPGDTCSNITSYFGYLNEAEFETWNPALGSNCSGLTTGDYYCIANSTCLPLPSVATTSPTPTQTGILSTCKQWYQATLGDDCDIIPQYFASSFTTAELLSWNPALLSDCSGLIPGDYYCVAVPGISASACQASTSTSALPTNGNGPQPEQPGIPNSCTQYWLVGPNDNCTTIAAANGISVPDLTSWNPALHANCSGLEADFYVCIGGPPPITSTSVISSVTSSSNSSTVGSTTGPTSTAVSSTTSSSSGVSSSSTISSSKSGSSGISSSSSVSSSSSSVKSASSTVSSTATSSSPVSTSTSSKPISTTSSSASKTSSTSSLIISTPSPHQTGMVSGCERFYWVESGNDCFDIAQEANVNLTSFYAWNPAVKTDCSGLQASEYVCIGTAGPIVTIKSGNPYPATPTPYQSGMVSNCARFYDVESGDGCFAIASDADIALTNFYSWNPAVSTDCSGLEASVYVCIGTTGQVTTITSGTPVPAPTSTTTTTTH